MINKLMKKVNVLSLVALISFSVVGCDSYKKVGGEELPISGIEEFETYREHRERCAGCHDKDVFYNTNIGQMCKKCFKDYEKYLNKLAKRVQKCGKCKGVPTTIIETDRYHNPTEVSCDKCVEIYETEQYDRYMNEVIEEADLSKEHKNIAKKHARKDAKLVTGTTPEEKTNEVMALTEEFMNNVVSMYAISSSKQEAMMYIYMNELSEAVN